MHGDHGGEIASAEKPPGAAEERARERRVRERLRHRVVRVVPTRHAAREDGCHLVVCGGCGLAIDDDITLRAYPTRRRSVIGDR